MCRRSGRSLSSTFLYHPEAASCESVLPAGTPWGNSWPSGRWVCRPFLVHLHPLLSVSVSWQAAFTDPLQSRASIVCYQDRCTFSNKGWTSGFVGWVLLFHVLSSCLVYFPLALEVEVVPTFIIPVFLRVLLNHLLLVTKSLKFSCSNHWHGFCLLTGPYRHNTFPTYFVKGINAWIFQGLCRRIV